MKKTLLLALSSCICIATAQAQFKQVGKENNLQLHFAPLGNTPISLNDGTIMYRKFNATGTGAIRVGLTVGNSKSTDIIAQAGDTNYFPRTENMFMGNFDIILNSGLNPEAQMVSKTFWFSIRPGYEKHFAGTERISPYVGAELVFGKSTTKSETDSLRRGNYSTVYYDTTTMDINVNAPWTVLTLNSKSGSTTFGINLIAGVDFYVVQNLSLGAELNFGYSMTKWSDTETEFIRNTPTSTSTGPDINGVTTTTTSSSNSVVSANNQVGRKTSGFGPGVIAKIKLGWLF